MPPNYLSRSLQRDHGLGRSDLDVESQVDTSSPETQHLLRGLGVSPLSSSNLERIEALRRNWASIDQDSDDWIAESATTDWRYLLATNLQPDADDSYKDRPLEVPPITNDCANHRKPCETVESIQSKEIPGVPFIKGKAYGKRDPTAASHDDVKQGNNNSCYLLAALMSMTRQAPGRLEDRIEYDEKSQKYKVWLYLPDKSGALSLQAVEIDGGFHVDEKGKPIYAKGGDSNRQGDELWPMLFEKAYAKIKGGYQGIDWGGDDRNEEVLEMLTGNEAEEYDVQEHSPDEVRAYLELLLEEKRIMTTVTMSDKRDPSIKTAPFSVLFPGGPSVKEELQPKHRFTIVAVDDKYVTLEYPAKGGNNTGQVPLETYVKYFTDIKSASTVPPKGEKEVEGPQASSQP